MCPDLTHYYMEILRKADLHATDAEPALGGAV